MQRSLGEARIEDIKADVERRIQAEEFIAAEQKPGTPGRSFTTPAMIELERETIEMVRDGQNQFRTLATEETRRAIAEDYRHLSDSQRTAVEQVLASRDQVTALEGTAGTGKTTTLAAIRDAAERNGYEVEGFAPTSRAAQKLREAGIEASTLQRHLARANDEPRSESRRLNGSHDFTTHRLLHRVDECDCDNDECTGPGQKAAWRSSAERGSWGPLRHAGPWSNASVSEGLVRFVCCDCRGRRHNNFSFETTRSFTIIAGNGCIGWRHQSAERTERNSRSTRIPARRSIR